MQIGGPLTQPSRELTPAASSARFDTALFTIQILRAAEQIHGVASTSILEREGVPASLLDEPQRPLSLRLASRLVEAAVAMTGDDLLGLRAGLHTRVCRELGLAGVLITHAPTLRAGMEGAVLMQNATSNVATLSIEEHRKHVGFRFHSRVDPCAYTDQTLEFHVGLSLSFCQVHMDPRTQPFALEVPAERLERHGRAAYEAALNREVVATRDHTGARYPMEGFLVEHESGRDVYDVLQPVVEREVAGLPRLERTRDFVRSAIERTFSTRARALELADAARLLGVSARTLQQRLQDEGTSLQALLDEVRRRLALRWLEDGCSREEVSARLGYSESSAFRRAWRRWHG